MFSIINSNNYLYINYLGGMKNIETISYTSLNEMYQFHTYRSVVVTLETVENTFKFRITIEEEYRKEENKL